MRLAPAPLPVPMCFSLYNTRAPFARKKRWMPLWRASSSPSACTPQPATIFTSAPSPMKKSLYTMSLTSLCVTQAGIYTVSPFVPGFTVMRRPGLSGSESICTCSVERRPAHWPSSRMLYAPLNAP